MAVHTLGNSTNTAHTLGAPVTPAAGSAIGVVGGSVINHAYVETDPQFNAWDKSTGITIDQSQITDGDTLVNLEDWTIEEEGNDVVIRKGDSFKGTLTDEGDLKIGGVHFDVCLVRNQELDNTLALAASTLLTISNKVGQVLTIDNLPNYDKFDVSGWNAMLSDPEATNVFPDSYPPSGDYLYKYDCTVDRVNKTLTFDGLYDISNFNIGDNLVLYNPFLNYTFVGDQSLGPILNNVGAPVWRQGLGTFCSVGCAMFRHSDGRFIMLISARSSTNKYRVGYMYTTDFTSWTVGNSDNFVFNPTVIPNVIAAHPYGYATPLNDGTGRYWSVLSCGRNTGISELRILYYDEDLTTFTYSDPILDSDDPGAELGYSQGSIIKIGNYYHLAALFVSEGGQPMRDIKFYKSLDLEGPYTLYQENLVTGVTANDGVAWSYAVDTPSLHNDGVKIFGLFGGQSYTSQSGTKGNRVTCLLDFNQGTETWSVSTKGPVIINPFYYQDIFGTYNWAGDHCGGPVSMYHEGVDTYVAYSMKGSMYQATLFKLNFHGGVVSNYVPYSGATANVDLGSWNIEANNLSGDNTGDQDLSVLVPYTGATGDVDLGTNRLTADDVTVNNPPSNGTDAANKTYVDSVVAAGIAWKAPVLDILTPLPGGASLGDRYVDTSDDSINEWNGAAWDTTAASTGDILAVTPGGTATPGWYTYNGSNWVYVAIGMAHNDTTGKQGGTAGEYYHLSAPQKTNVEYTIETTADAVPTGLAISSTGVTVGGDGSIFAYVVLTWNAISTNTFDMYRLRYKQHAHTYYNTGLTAKANTITIEGLVPNTSYDFGICSINKNGIASAYSADVTGTTAISTTTPNDVVTNSATAGIQYVILEWTASSNKDLSYYVVYRNTSNDSGGASIACTTKGTYFVDGGRTGGQIYYYWVKAVNTSGLASTNFSNVQSATPRNVVSADTNIAHQGWDQTCVFSATDADTVSWGSGSFITSAGTTYAINAGNTGNMSAKTYIYLNIGVSTTAYQTTTTASTAVGDGKVLVAIAQNHPTKTEATFVVMNDSSMNIDANSIVANSITASLIEAGTITANEIATNTITSDEILAIAAEKILIDGAVYLSNWRGNGGLPGEDLTKINGGNISTGTVTLSQLNFTPITGGNVIATINASSEGIKIDADNISISGSSSFSSGYDPTTKTAAVGGTYDSAASGPRVRIFPDANTGIQVIDNAGNDALKVSVGGSNVGDVVIGNYSGGQGIHYDQSANTTTFKGSILANGYLIGAQPHIVRKSASNNLRNSNDATASTSSGSYTKIKEITLPYGLLGTQRFQYQLYREDLGDPGSAECKVCYNGGTLLHADSIHSAPLGAGSIHLVEFDVTRNWGANDTVELWGTTDGTPGTTVYASYFRILYDDNPIVEVTSTNTLV